MILPIKVGDTVTIEKADYCIEIAWSGEESGEEMALRTASLEPPS